MLDVVELSLGPPHYADEPPASVIWLHGMGQEPSALIPTARLLGPPGRPPRGLFPRAPQQPGGLGGGRLVRAWFPQSVFSLDRIGLPDVLAMAERLHEVVDAETSRTGAGRVLLAGFSQGAVMALVTCLLHPSPLAGLALSAPYLPADLAAHLAERRSPANAATPVWIAHGADDWVIPPSAGAAVRDTLLGWGHPVSWHHLPAGHTPFPTPPALLHRFLHSCQADRR
ncbi:alpha/beta hydrolase [Kitasatospora sp. NPDC048239]|uniref:alpha/beta hydrolase n=1 Tax=Kitasatospora sp. NPDC048239 TaxID=3364046 RepID=UPI003718AA62